MKFSPTLFIIQPKKDSFHLFLCYNDIVGKDDSMKFYRCPVCGNIITVVEGNVSPVRCCGKELEELVPNTQEGAVEKHIPVCKRDGEKVEVNVLSGGEKVRCVLSKIMLSGANFLIFDEPTNHLDMESITSVNEGMKNFKGNILFTSHDHQLTQTVANRIIDIKQDKIIDREITYNEYLGIE